ncbi:hypothetical protein Pfo_008393 [Paulownia fortunei]|nr:hypothetical protein Pfo_008393 [Paulownia fortunei]
MSKKSSFSSSPLLVFCLWCAILPTISAAVHAEALGEEDVWASGPLVKKEQRSTLVSTEYGEISAARVSDNINGSYLLHFFTLEPNSLFLPVILHADMVFYVYTGSGKLSWTEEDDLKSTELRRGDVYRLEQGAVFFMQSNLETEMERQKLRIHAIFANSDNDLHEPATGPYSSIHDMVLGFNKKVLQAAFKVPKEVIDELLNGTKPPAIIHGLPKTKRTAWEMETQFVRGLLGSRSYNIFELNKKKKKESAKLFNLFKEDKDFENCNGWSTTITRKKLSALKGSNIGLLMVNLTTGSMMGPHWNPMATEIAVVLQGRGMVRVVCSSVSNETGCRNMRFEVEEGDTFAVPRFHPMAQMAFNNETLVFMGFSTSTKRNHPQFLAGQASVLRTLDKDVLAISLNVTNMTLDQLLAPQDDSVILGCVSCAEEEFRIMEEEIEKEREEAREREEEEAKKREEERRREEEEARKREEEEARREEEERKRWEEEEEERKKREEEEEEDEERKKREEEERQREEEEARQREQEQEQEEARKREEEAAKRKEEEKKRREEEEEEARQRQQKQEQEEARKREEAAARREEEEAKQREQAQEEARKREEEEEVKRRQEEQEEEARQREEEEQEEQQGGRSEEEQAAEEERRREEEAQREEEAARHHEQERERQQEEEEGGEEEEQEGGSSRGEGGETELEHENQADKEWGIIPKRLAV